MKNDRIIKAPISKIVEAIVKKDLEVWGETFIERNGGDINQFTLDENELTEALSTLPTVEMSDPIAAVTKGWGIMQHATDLGNVVSPDECLFIGTLQECVDFVNEHQPLHPSEREASNKTIIDATNVIRALLNNWEDATNVNIAKAQDALDLIQRSVQSEREVLMDYFKWKSGISYIGDFEVETIDRYLAEKQSKIN